MNKFTKKTAFGVVGVAAVTAALAMGASAPAMASTSYTSPSTRTNHSSEWTTATTHATTRAYTGILRNVANGSALDNFSGGTVGNQSPVVVAPQVGGVLNGSALASGNTINAPVTAPVASGNQTSAPVASGNKTPVANGSANGTSTGNGTSTSGSVSNPVNTNGMVDGILSNVNSGIDLGSILGR